MENQSSSTNSKLLKQDLFKIAFFYLITVISFSAAFYKALYISDFKLASLLFLVAFLSFAFANYPDFKMISALGFRIEKFNKLTRDAERIVNQLENRSELLIDQLVTSKLEASRNMDINLLWQRLRKFRLELNKDAHFEYSHNQKRQIKSYFVFDFIHYRFRKIFDKISNDVRDQFEKYINQNFSDAIKDNEKYNEIIEVMRKALANVNLSGIDIFNCYNFDVNELKGRIESAIFELSKYNMEISIDAEFEKALDELSAILNAEDVLDDRNLQLIATARKSMF